jgi:hexosaminidase
VIPAGDGPRFEWRGAMLDVARHFLGPRDVQRFIDTIARYRFNRLHLHLTDDQGWRIEIESWPRLAEVGGRTAVGGGEGGFFTREEYAGLCAYAAERGITVVPEVDVPGHVNAALVAYPELAPGGDRSEPYTGTGVGFSTLDTGGETVRRFVEDVFGELAELTPGPYLHIGGDEASKTSHDDYLVFIERVSAAVSSLGKTPIGWEEIAAARLPAGTIVQLWKNEELARAAVRQGARLIMSPAARTYFDHKYDADTRLGTTWAGHISLRDAYDWDPGTLVEGVTEADVLGVEATLWSETLETLADVEEMAFPRLLATAELGWSRAPGGWDDFAGRAAAEGRALAALGVNYFRTPEIAWR